MTFSEFIECRPHNLTWLKCSCGCTLGNHCCEPDCPHEDQVVEFLYRLYYKNVEPLYDKTFHQDAAAAQKVLDIFDQMASKILEMRDLL